MGGAEGGGRRGAWVGRNPGRQPSRLAHLRRGPDRTPGGGPTRHARGESVANGGRSVSHGTVKPCAFCKVLAENQRGKRVLRRPVRFRSPSAHDQLALPPAQPLPPQPQPQAANASQAPGPSGRPTPESAELPSSASAHTPTSRPPSSRAPRLLVSQHKHDQGGSPHSIRPRPNRFRYVFSYF